MVSKTRCLTVLDHVRVCNRVDDFLDDVTIDDVTIDVPGDGTINHGDTSLSRSQGTEDGRGLHGNMPMPAGAVTHLHRSSNHPIAYEPDPAHSSSESLYGHDQHQHQNRRSAAAAALAALGLNQRPNSSFTPNMRDPPVHDLTFTLNMQDPTSH